MKPSAAANAAIVGLRFVHMALSTMEFAPSKGLSMISQELRQVQKLYDQKLEDAIEADLLRKGGS